MRVPAVRWLRLKPGWYLLLLLLLYGAVVSALLGRSNRQLRELRMAETEMTGARAEVALPGSAQAAAAPTASPEQGLWFPLPGARLPEDEAHLPGSPRAYRQGVSQGFDFYDGDSGVPVPFGAPVIAAASGSVIRADASYHEPSQDEWQQLLAAVAENGASDEELDRLRGRQLWLRTADGRVLRYAHLSGLRPGLAVGQSVYRGQVVGYVGNSGTDEGVAGSRLGARLHFEVWEDGRFFGQDMTSDELRIAATSLFTGP